MPSGAAYGPETVREIAGYYLQWSGWFGLRCDVLWAQALLETGGFRFGGKVTKEQWNLCGLRKPDGSGFYSFATPELGVLAHIAHMAVHVLPKCPEGYTAECLSDPKHPAGHWHDMSLLGDLESVARAWCPTAGYASALCRVWNEGV